MTIVMIVGFICDINHLYLFRIDDINTLSLTIMQLQGTIGILVISIISFISGIIEESYYGVSICNYYLNIKPKKLTFKRLIFIVLILYLASIMAYVIHFYTVITCIFIITLVCVWISITHIYSTFTGKKELYDEIEKHILEQIKLCDNSFDSLFIHFCDDWKRNIIMQDNLNYEKTVDVYKKFIIKICEEKNNDRIQLLQKHSTELCLSCLNTYNPIVQQRGICLLYNIYEVLNTQINGNSFDNIEFHLLWEIGEDIIEVMNGIDNRYIERTEITIYDFFYEILLFCVEMRKVNDTSSHYDDEIRILKKLSSSVGGYVHVQRLKGHIIKERYWVNFFDIKLFTTETLDSSKMNLYSEEILEIYFSYFYGLIMNGEENIIVNAIFNRGINLNIGFENKYQIVFYLAIYTYLYYLGYEENICSKNIRKCAKKILMNGDVRDSFINLQYMLYETMDNEIWNMDIYHLLNNILKKYELVNYYKPFKYTIIEDVILRFYFFVIASIAYAMDEDIVLKCVTIDLAHAYLRSSSTSSLKNTFQNAYNALNNEKNKENHIDDYYDVFIKPLKNKYKMDKIEEVNLIEKGFNKKQIERDIEENIRKAINDKLGVLLKCNKGKQIQIELIDYNFETKDLDGDLLNEIQICNSFLSGITDFLKQNNYLNVKNRQEQSLNNMELISYLQDNNYDLIIGRKNIISPRTYENKKLLDDYLKKYYYFNHNINAAFVAINTKNVKLEIKDIDISINSCELKIDKYYDEDTENYIYSDDGEIEFTKEELDNYLSKKNKNVKIVINILIECEKEKVGTIFKYK